MDTGCRLEDLPIVMDGKRETRVSILSACLDDDRTTNGQHLNYCESFKFSVFTSVKSKAINIHITAV